MVIEPDNIFRILWDIFYLITFVYIIFFYPILFFFELTKKEYGDLNNVLGKKIPFYICFGEIIINFQTAYYYKGEVISNKTKIIKYYLKNSFFLDFFILIAYFLDEKSLIFKILPLFLVIILVKIKKASSKVYK